ncbi:FeoC-like transcriptional regulator [Halothiobacillus sp.]|jgi:hypothetical protein|uniref:FeoC-like transcriptional regulator n=1 Tax=Halothiobacillus sp. TaxID=1891311 RepID=UPI0029848FB6|nr:FeoC-like transcriptional regulator [Halothiobacillus sp.]MDY0146508.1 FeoC-like transcriptional regulator [Halothiobacillus sp.]
MNTIDEAADTVDRVLTPSNVKRYMKQRGTAPLSDIINRFDAPPEAVLAILDFWQQRHHIRKIAAPPAASCGTGCSSCSTSPGAESSCKTPVANDLYEWIESDALPFGFDVLADYEQAWVPTSPHGV